MLGIVTWPSQKRKKNRNLDMHKTAYRGKKNKQTKKEIKYHAKKKSHIFLH